MAVHVQPPRCVATMRMIRKTAPIFCTAAAAWANPASQPLSPTNVFAPASTPADMISRLSGLVLTVTGAIFLTVFCLLLWAVVKFRQKASSGPGEPAQIYGSTQVELAWTVIPVLIVIVLLLATVRAIASIQNAVPPPSAVEVSVIGHQYWWEYRYAGSSVVTANELHVPVSDPAHPTPTFLKLLSADTDHSFWVPRLAGKTDLIPNHPNTSWIDPHQTGLYLGQCSQYCGVQHAKMLLRVYVETREQFDHWIGQQSRPAVVSDSAMQGRRTFESTACVNCHTVRGTGATGKFGPDLTHLMSRDTIGAGIVANTPGNLRRWIQDPSLFKPGCLMPAMGLTDSELDAVTAYMETLR
jgi:cytochrome c oxidase subunit II